MDKVLARQRLVALEARGEFDILFGLVVRRESAILPFAIAERVRVFAAPAGTLLHRVETEYFAFDEASVGTFDGIALSIKLRRVPDRLASRGRVAGANRQCSDSGLRRTESAETSS